MSYESVPLKIEKVIKVRYKRAQCVYGNLRLCPRPATKFVIIGRRKYPSCPTCAIDVRRDNPKARVVDREKSDSPQDASSSSEE